MDPFPSAILMEALFQFLIYIHNIIYTHIHHSHCQEVEILLFLFFFPINFEKEGGRMIQ